MTTLFYPIVWGIRKASREKKPTDLFKKTLLFLLFLSSFSFANATTKTSTGNGNWNNAGTWSPSGVPATGDNVVIASGHTITINANTNALAGLTINGTLVIGNNNTDRIITVTGNILIGSSGSFTTAGNGDNELHISGNLTNNGSFDMNAGGAWADVSFLGTSNQTLSGTGTTTDLYSMTINNTGPSNNNIVEISSSKFTAATGFLTLTKGILKVSGSFTFSNTFFNTANPVIHADEGLWLNNANVTVTGQNGDTQLYGLLRISAGTYNVGITADWWLYYYTGAELIMEGGALNIAGAFFGATTSQTINFLQSGGVITVNTAGNSYLVASFEIWAPSSVFTMSGGTIVLQRAASAFTDYINYSANSTITGGKIQAGNTLTPAGAVFWVNSTAPLYDMEVKTTNSPVSQLRSNTTVLHDIIIWGTLDAATQNVDISIGHNWTNNGNFLPGSASVTLNGSTAQTIGGTATTTFNDLTITNTGGGVSLATATNISGTCTFTSGIVTSSASSLLTFNDNAIASGANNNTSNPSYVSGPVKKIGNDAFTFPVGKPGAGYHLCGISAPANTSDAFTAEYMRASATSLGSITAAGLYRVSNCEFWKIERNTGSSSVNVTLSWNGYSNCNLAAYVNDLATLVVAHHNGTNWNSYGTSSHTGNVSSGTVTWNAVSSFSAATPFSLGSNSPATNPLPVKFSAINAYATGADNRIEWTNQTEEGVVKYELERSSDGQNFTAISSLPARSNSGAKEEYAATDAAVNNLTRFYRVKAVEYSGETVYSTIAKVSRDITEDLKLLLYPNPVTAHQFTIQLNSHERAMYIINVVDQAGRKILSANWQHNGGNASRSVELPAGISPGLYFITVSGNDKVMNAKIIVQ